MARIRSLKPTFWGDETVSEWSRDARLLFLGLISMADDEGRFLASFPAIVGFVFPNDPDVTPVKLRKWLAELTAKEQVILYNGGKVKYGAIRKFRKHQRISHPQPSTLPPPPPDALFDE